MKLDKIKIQNYRSILNQEIDFVDNCIGLIGLNESGKSNVLNSIRSIDGNFALTYKDKSKISGKFPTIEYFFSIEQIEKDALNEKLKERLNKEITTIESLHFELNEINNIVKTVKIDRVADTINRVFSFDFDYNFKVTNNILELAEGQTIPPELTITINDAPVSLASIKLIEKKLVSEEHLSFYTEYSPDRLNEIIKSVITAELETKIPQIIFWTYQEKYLLPSEISYDDLIKNDNPYENSAPLFNILLLCRALPVSTIEDLKFKISVWKQDSSERRKDSALITESLNNYVKGIWADYNQDLTIVLEENKITIHINDPNSSQKNFYEMEARSQGFKTFISFILTIAAEAENGIVKNFVLLLDEPETHLHPSGVRYMKEELFKLCKKGNYIVYATHSLFMIDRKYLRRHIIVSKEHELTHLKKVERNNFIQEAVLYEALGTQVDEFSIGTKNVVFEGELDLKLFNFYVKNCVDKDTFKFISDFESWDGGGTKRIEQFFTNKILPKGSSWILVLDNDSPGQNLAKNLNVKFKDDPNNTVICYHYSSISNYELEDILPKNIIQKAFDQTLSSLSLVSEYEIDFSIETKVVSSAINEYKHRHRLSQEQSSLIEELFKKTMERLAIEEIERIEKVKKAAKLAEFETTFKLYVEFIDNFFRQIVPEK